MLHGQQPVLHISSPRHTSELASHTDTTALQIGEDTPASPCGVDTTRGATVIGYKPSRDWRKARVVCIPVSSTAKCVMIGISRETPPPQFAPNVRVHRSSCRGANQEVGPPNGSKIAISMEGAPQERISGEEVINDGWLSR